METFQRILLAFITFFISMFFAWINEANAAKFSWLETKIIAESNTVKIKKLQNFLQKLDLYNGKIDGKYNTVLPSLLAYQKKAWLIKNNSDWGAGYFWVQTLTAIQRDYPAKFDQYKYIIEQDKPAEWERYFYVTAYYSPLPGQRRYTTWSYAWDIRLNWGWKRTASGKWVFPGLLAWPRNYNYGTKIELEGIWVGAVEDRWGAIVNSWERGFEHDRIDIWMWYWDEWLVRALKWGKRKIKWKIVSNEVNVNVAFNDSIISSNLRLYVTPESNSVDIKKLQTLFSELNLYDGGIDWKYISIKDDLLDFQLKHKIITSKYSEQAWYFWKKTIAVLQSQYKINDSIFHEPVKPVYDDFTWVTRKDKFALVRLRNKVVTYFEKKYKWNKLKITAQKTQLQRRIDKVIKKSKNKNKIKKLEYLKIIL